MSNKTAIKGTPIVAGFFEKRTSSVQYIVADPETKRCAIIDPVLDFDLNSGATATHSADELLDYIKQENYDLQWILDTHPHADHLSAAGYLKDKTWVPTAIGEKVVEVQKLWKGIYNYADAFPTDGSQWDRLFRDGEQFKLGNIDIKVLLTAGHTLASIPDIRLLRSRIWWAMSHSFTIPSSCPTSVQPGRTFRAAAHACCGGVSSASWTCRMRLDCSRVTIIAPPGAKNLFGKVPSLVSAQRTSI